MELISELESCPSIITKLIGLLTVPRVGNAMVVNRELLLISRYLGEVNFANLIVSNAELFEMKRGPSENSGRTISLSKVPSA